MTTTISFTPEAQQRLDDYLRQVRDVTAGAKSVNGDEVAADIREHIEEEFHAATEPVSLDKLEPVLKRLGRPEQWVPPEELPWWRRVVLRLRSGPEDWRLTYLAFVLFGLGLAFPPMLLASFLAARAALSVVDDPSEDLGTRKWLLYPILIPAYLALCLLILIGAPLMLAAIPWGIFNLPIPLLLTTAPLAACWWVILGLVVRRRPILIRFLFYPFAERVERRLGTRLLLAGVAILMLCVVGLGLDQWAIHARIAESNEQRARSAPLQGTWKVVRAEGQNGPYAPNYYKADPRIFFTGNTVASYPGCNILPRANLKFKLHRINGVNAIDMDQPNGEQSLGIYELEGDQLKLCISGPGVARPTDFTVSPQQTRILFELQRDKH